MAYEKRLIDANELMKQVKAIHKAVDTSAVNTDYDTGFHSATSYGQGLIVYMPTVDAVEVVRCKDCKCWNRFKGTFGDCIIHNTRMGEDDFCSYGEGRE